MKKLIMQFLIIMVSLLFLVIHSQKLYANEIEEISLEFDIQTDKNYFYEDDKQIVIGNNKYISSNKIKTMMSGFTEKILIIYFVDKTNNKINPQLSNTNAIIFFYKDDTLRTATLDVDSIDEGLIVKEIECFIYETLDEIKNCNEITKKGILNKGDKTFISTSIYDNKGNVSRKVVKPRYGYITIRYHVGKYRANDNSSLWLVETSVEFTPGSVARANGDKSYLEYKNYAGYIHIEAYQSIDEISQSYTYTGGRPYFKDAYPTNSSGKLTINSSFSAGLTLGYSFINGFSTDGSTKENESNIGANISYEYSKLYENDEPRLSAQSSPKIDNQYQWSYAYRGKRDGEKETYHLNTGYIFEQNNNHDMPENAISFRYDVQLEMRRTMIGFYNTEFVKGTFHVGDFSQYA